MSISEITIVILLVYIYIRQNWRRSGFQNSLCKMLIFLRFLYYFFSIPLELSILPSKSGTGNFSRLPRSSVDFPNESLGKNWQTPRGLSVFHEEGRGVSCAEYTVLNFHPPIFRYGMGKKEKMNIQKKECYQYCIGISEFRVSFPGKNCFLRRRRKAQFLPAIFTSS